ncbi:type 4a pilus biogenesis protein PilO [Vibrio comitans]
MSWLLFYDWSRLFQLPTKWVSTFGFALALVIAGILWGVWGQQNKNIQAQLLDELALQQQSHLMYLRKLKQLDDKKIDYRGRYLKQANVAPSAFSKTGVFHYLSSGLAESSVNVSSWQWEQELHSQHLAIDLKGTYPEIATFLRRSLSFSEVVTIKELSLSRPTVDTTLINGRLILTFFIAESTESQ